MRECSGFGKPLVSSLPRPCIYPVVGLVELDDALWPVCYWHEKVFSGLITDAGGRPLSWSPHLQKPRAEEPEDLMAFLRREWAPFSEDDEPVSSVL